MLEELTFSRYVLNGMLARVYAPELSVVVVREKPLTELASMTVALGTTAPVGSVTRPVRVPALPAEDCARAGAGRPGVCALTETAVKQTNPTIEMKENIDAEIPRPKDESMKSLFVVPCCTATRTGASLGGSKVAWKLDATGFSLEKIANCRTPGPHFERRSGRHDVNRWRTIEKGKSREPTGKCSRWKALQHRDDGRSLGRRWRLDQVHDNVCCRT
jgi:hypothetical protein